MRYIDLSSAPASASQSESTPQPVSRKVLSTLPLLLALLTGCGGTNAHTVDSNPIPILTGNGVAISGRTLLGARPLLAASVQLYAAGTSGNGSAPTALSTAATTDTSGSFTIPAATPVPPPTRSST